MHIKCHFAVKTVETNMESIVKMKHILDQNHPSVTNLGTRRSGNVGDNERHHGSGGHQH